MRRAQLPSSLEGISPSTLDTMTRLSRAEDPLVELVSFHGARQVGLTATGPELEFYGVTSGVKRDGSIFRVDGADLQGFSKNNVFCWGHEYGLPPIGNIVSTRLVDTINYGRAIVIRAVPLPDGESGLEWRDFSKFVFEMYRDRVMNAVSIGWRAVEWEWIRDPKTDMITGVDFLASDVLEWSAVTVPADPDATQTTGGRSAVTPFMRLCQQGRIPENFMRYFTKQRGQKQRFEACVVLRSSPEEETAIRAEIEQDTRATVPYSGTKMADKAKAWDGSGARSRLAAWASSDGSGDKDKVSWSKYARGFAWYDSGNAKDFGSYKLPHHDVESGTLVVVWRGVAAAAGRLDSTQMPDADKAAVKSHLEKHYHQFGEKAPWEGRGIEPVETDAERAVYAKLVAGAEAQGLRVTGAACNVCWKVTLCGREQPDAFLHEEGCEHGTPVLVTERVASPESVEIPEEVRFLRDLERTLVQRTEGRETDLSVLVILDDVRCAIVESLRAAYGGDDRRPVEPWERGDGGIILRLAANPLVQRAANKLSNKMRGMIRDAQQHCTDANAIMQDVHDGSVPTTEEASITGITADLRQIVEDQLPAPSFVSDLRRIVDDGLPRTSTRAGRKFGAVLDMAESLRATPKATS